jgi:hypothetical protein
VDVRTELAQGAAHSGGSVVWRWHLTSSRYGSAEYVAYSLQELQPPARSSGRMLV